MSRNKQVWHPKFIEYMNFIAQHHNYKGMPFPHKANGDIRWIVTGKSLIGIARTKWWDEKRAQLRISKIGAWKSKVARIIHPTKEKPCQVCGEVMSIEYIYPNLKGGLSPGSMSNVPDRFDGFHTYNSCCRAKHDTGRHKNNLSNYSEDRRAYENWCDGDWKAASRLMGLFRKNALSPDHVGPISLGFRHRPSFRPLTAAENSARNNRMTYNDVLILLAEEKHEEVISQHTKQLWNLLKDQIRNDSDALQLSKLLRENLHCVLSIFAVITKSKHKRFLIKNFLHPEYSKYSIEFKGFDPTCGRYDKIIKVLGNKKQYRNNAKRYIRISFSSLKQYTAKENRHLKNCLSETDHVELEKVLQILNDGGEKEALTQLNKLFSLLAHNLAKKFNPTAYDIHQGQLNL